MLNNQFRIKQNSIIHISLILIALLLVAGSLHLLTGDFSDSHFAKRVNWLIVPVGVIGTAFFSLVTIYIIYRAFKYKYLLIIDIDGFIDSSTLGAFGYVAWRNVQSISIFSIAEQKLIGVNIDNTQKLMNKSPCYVKKLVKADMKMGYPPITINLNSAKEKPEEVLAIMNKYWNQWKLNNECKKESKALSNSF